MAVLEMWIVSRRGCAAQRSTRTALAKARTHLFSTGALTGASATPHLLVSVYKVAAIGPEELKR
jgi:hypothetical protein